MEKTKEAILNALIEASDQYGVEWVLGRLLGGVGTIRLPLSQGVYDTPIEELDLSVRGSNGMKRTNVFTIGGVVDLVNADALIQVRNLGKKTQSEIKTKLLIYCYERLTRREKRLFFQEYLTRNGYEN